MGAINMSGDFGSDLSALIAAYEAEGHSVFRPSAASRWMICAGSVLAEIVAANDSAGYDAAYGTVAHAIAEETLRLNGPGALTTTFPEWAKPGASREERGFVIVIDEEMLSFVQQYVDWIYDLGPGDVWLTEQRVDFSDLTPLPNQGGTADHIHIANRTLTVSDLKFGTKVRVYARGNKQLRLYGYGAWREWSPFYDIDRIVLRIAQPRLEVFETWEITVDELLTFAAEARIAAHRAWKPNAPRTPHPDACRWCAVSTTCPAVAKAAEMLADNLLDDLDAVEIEAETVSVPDAVILPRKQARELSTKELATILRWRGMFDAWFRDIHDEIMRRKERGETVEGWKVIEGQSKRRWTDEAEAAEGLELLGLTEDQMWKRTLISPKQASDLMRVRKIKKPDEAIQPWVTRPQGYRALVVEEDARPDIESDGDDLLDDLA